MRKLLGLHSARMSTARKQWSPAFLGSDVKFRPLGARQGFKSRKGVLFFALLECVMIGNLRERIRSRGRLQNSRLSMTSDQRLSFSLSLTSRRRHCVEVESRFLQSVAAYYTSTTGLQDKNSRRCL
jgi:hypothetical protein